jgi:hypothetical protein
MRLNIAWKDLDSEILQRLQVVAVIRTRYVAVIYFMTFTKDRPGLSSERAPHRHRTTNSRPKLLKRKRYLVKRPQSGLDIKTY